MLYTPPPHIAEMIQTIRQFLREEVYPLEREYIPRGFKGAEAALEPLRQKVKEMGLWAPHMPKEYGGLGLSLTEFAYISEELGRSVFGHYVFNSQAPDIGNMELLLAHGSEEQKERWLKPLIAGEIRSCFSMTEPEHAGSNPVWMSTTAVRDGDEYVINGHKWFSTSADGAAFTVVMAVTDPNASKYRRASMIIVPTDNPGFVLEANTPVAGHVGEGYFTHGEVRFINARVPVSNRIGEEGEGFILAQERLGPGRIHHTMRWIGIAERAFDLMCRYAVKRELSPGDPLANKQIIRAWIAESRAEIDAARLLVLDTAARIDELGAYASRNEISLIKFHVANMLQKVLYRAIQVHGGLGVTDYTPLAYWYGHERAARIYDGADEVHKMVVARRILREYEKALS